jgi:hypothetical protein
LERAYWPYSVEVAENKGTFCRIFASWTEAKFEYISPGALTVALHARAKGFRVICGQVHAGIHSLLLVGRRLKEDQLAG